MPTSFLFVYGSLLSEVPSVMSQFLGAHSQGFFPTYLPGKLYDLGYYPGFVFLPDAHGKVYGEVHQLEGSVRVLAELDAYECVDDEIPEYRRLLLPPLAEQGPVWIYIYVQPVTHLPEIAGGDYRTFYPNNRDHLNFIKQGRNG
jgi:gamma-glutamylcyclotransferase (GGCT)/AIG2-like uncharacterized protein YtfP